MANSSTAPSTPPRRAILDLAPLELECLRALWPLGEASVRDVHAALLPTRPRAYTTILTILDRLAHKGLVARRKSGRAWLYSPNLSAADARSSALAKLIEHFFAGSTSSLLAHLSSAPPPDETRRPPHDYLPDHASRPRPNLDPSPADTSAPPRPSPRSLPKLDPSLSNDPAAPDAAHHSPASRPATSAPASAPSPARPKPALRIVPPPKTFDTPTFPDAPPDSADVSASLNESPATNEGRESPSPANTSALESPAREDSRPSPPRLPDTLL